MTITMKYFHIVLILLGGTHLLRAQPSASPLIKSIGESGSVSSVNVDLGKPTNPWARPQFDDIAPKNITAIVGQTAELNCYVKRPGDRVVSWIRKKDLHILTSSIHTYTGDGRFSAKHPESSDEWTLKIEYVQPRDAGIYECQVNTEPKMNLAFTLRVEESAPVPATTAPNSIRRTFNSAAQAKIQGQEDVYVKKGSTISLMCTVNVQSTPPSSVSWHHGGAVVDFDSPRGGVSLETEKTESGTTSRLLVTQARLSDSGNYTCIPSNANPASVMVHVLNGEHPAAMQHGGSCGIFCTVPIILLTGTTVLISNLLR
ncbi:basement membrane-specific heparan sulfate proteoglycan core protein-like isoform X2 [Vespa mandarinia]|uniref:basement membrane-specific heparan sulfate proteoglycan core protein-like isoform X2 n=1 Tax=Vespa mandarinia TaxID=7446 RepID=UPI001618F168|nr:basement membrane-specific heparan sulfate proteoglycan core protein-like isoform X2 [Vespa mandarinia]XP_046838002.1 basement membrane-specific heparan sulfate proteoglycan core protein-like isoform X2 [Vespa crabro]